MVQKLFALSKVETKRLLWIMGLIFAIFLVFQYFELPYSTALPSFFSAKNLPVLGKSYLQNGDSLSNDSAHTATESTLERATNNTRTSNFVWEGKGGPNTSLGLEEDDKDSEESSYISLEKKNRTSISGDVEHIVDNKFEPVEARGPDQNWNIKFDTSYGNSSVDRIVKESDIVTSDHVGSSIAGFASSPPPTIPSINSSHFASPIVVDTSIITPTELVEKDTTTTLDKNEKSERLNSDLKQTEDASSIARVAEIIRKPKVWQKKPPIVVYPISKMNNMLLQSQASYYSVIPQWSAAVDHELKYVASQIENAPIVKNDPNLYAPLFRNVSMFKRSYELMEDILKVYVYKEGEKPILHTPLLEGIYASEGWFMKQLEASQKFVTKNPQKAHLFYLPFSSRLLKLTLYVPDSHSRRNLVGYLKNYLEMVAAKYPFWNRTEGADHFFAACHDWAPAETKQLMAKCIRALCNADVNEGFVFGKDVSLPETYVRSAENPLKDVGGKPPSKRPILAFFAGRMHGYLRPILLHYWENKDPDMKIFDKLPNTNNKRKKRKGIIKNYAQYMKNSKYCICARGYEVNSPRVVEAIFYECVPVIISDNFVPPFFDVLNWESFAVFVLEKDIPNLKNILVSIPEKRYRKMQMMVKKVQKHFLWNAKPLKYDIFHMILHSVWFNRIHRISPIN
ncbi:probable glycosyltransferase At3g07620 [Ziziphus jujuba]|uniref:Probable glycosyltransferase At3g07620 n=1 Tax=Ziziphus jujuba TaxID=326968 RepID=A0A6P3ZXD9_ZIZJJ|nr:probable glycosyltransferase At3g07620 [Ziziphus jujuba]